MSRPTSRRARPRPWHVVWHRVGRRDERGAVLILVCLAMTVMMVAASMSIDVGRLVDNNRTMQLVADAASLDASLQLDGGTLAEVQAPVDAAALYSAERNGFTPASAGGPAGDTLTVQMGVWDAATSTFTAITDPDDTVDTPDAVQVTASEPTPFFFTTGTFSAHRVSLALGSDTPPTEKSASEGTFSVGSWLASFDSSQVAVLNALLSSRGSSVSLTAADYEALAGASVDFGDLDTAASAGSPSQLLAASVTPKGWAGYVASALGLESGSAQADGQASEAATLTADQSLVSEIGTDLSATGSFDVCSLVEVDGSCSPAGATGAEATADVLSLLVGSAELANGASAFTTDIGTVTGVQVQANLTQPMQTQTGPVGTTITTAQVSVQLTVPLSVPLVSGAQLSVATSGAQATGALDSLGCASGPSATDSMTVGVTTQAAQVSATATALGLASASGSAGAGGGSASLSFSSPFSPADAQSTAGSTGSVPLSVTGTSALATAANSVLSTLDPDLGGILQVLGVSYAGATVIADGVDCAPPSLVQ